MSGERRSGPQRDSMESALERLPSDPGCYLFKNESGEIVYVGKALRLRARVRSYFQKGAKQDRKTRALVSEVRDLEFIVTRDELDALVLENNLIKRHRPRFNVMLRDDKNFPYLKLTWKEDFPRVVLVRKPKSDGSLYFGPFLPASHARRTLRMIPKFFQVANCHVRFDGKQRPCLYYHIDQCLAPCAGKADQSEYRDRAEQVRLFLSGRNAELKREIEGRMSAASESQKYEQAARFRDMLRALDSLADKRQMTSVDLEPVDYWAEYREDERVALELFRMREGRVVGRREFAFEAGVAPEKFYDVVLPQFYIAEEVPKEIVLPRLPADLGLIDSFLERVAGRKVKIDAPSRGERRRFLDVVARNAQLLFEARFQASHTRGVEALEALRDALGFDEAPFRIEGFDVSHTRGTEPRASMVVFEGGRPKKSDYRTYKVAPAEPGDDFAAIREAVARRYARLAREGKKFPDLVLIDGGKGQLSAALEALDEAGVSGLPVASLAKREEELFLEGRDGPLLLDRHDPALRLVQQVRDEAHRFALSRHRRARSRATISSALTRIAGIGPTTTRRLLEQFGSVDGVASASVETLAAAVGPAKARLVKDGLATGADAGNGEGRG